MSSKPAKAAETTETVEAAVQKSLTQNRQNIPRSSRQNADANSDVSDSQLNDYNESDETQIVYK